MSEVKRKQFISIMVIDLFVNNCYQFYASNKLDRDVPRLWMPTDGAGIAIHENYKHFLAQVDNSELQRTLNLIDAEMEKLQSLNKQWAFVLAEYFKFTLQDTPQSLKRLRQQIDRHRKTEGASWVNLSICQPLLAQTQQVVETIRQLVKSAQEQIYQLYGYHVIGYEDIGHQRAKDLIDKAEGEEKTERAIQLLQKALRYGTSGIQASKALISLGSRYEDLDDAPSAIHCYTRAIEAWRPIPLLFFWRGQLYFRQGQRSDALKDFEMALSLTTPESLPSSEREQATRYIAKICALEQ